VAQWRSGGGGGGGGSGSISAGTGAEFAELALLLRHTGRPSARFISKAPLLAASLARWRPSRRAQS